MLFNVGNNMKQQIILVRGLPGSGKTTFAKEHVNMYPEFRHVEADMWFDTKDGYKFNTYELTSAHTWCVTQTEGVIRLGFNAIVSNTFTVAAECAPYYVIADKHDCVLTIVECAGEFGNIHGTPEVILDTMKMRWVPNEKIESTFYDKDLSPFANNPYDAYQFFSMYERVCHV